MSTLLPSYATRHVLSGLTEYLTTSFSLANESTANALRSFLGDATDGMFRGPYVRMRLPFAQATDWEGVLEWLPGWFTPYHHQAQAFRRLTSIGAGGPRRPEPTLVITGTGSGKTEAFLYPVLNHAVRARREGQRGVKALLLYPMNALANDQASRLAALLSSDPALGAVTAGIYTGDQAGSDVKKVSRNSLITSREQIRQDPPDILITNYKMLDQLLLREADRDIWRISANSLQYLVLDEFHTYDGAQGTDVALLLRRLGVQLKKNLPVSQRSVFEERPLGNVTPVATSATLGGKEEYERVLAFATTIFGEKFEPDAIVGEVSLTFDQWVAEMQAKVGVAAPGATPSLDTIGSVLDAVEKESATGEYAQVVLDVFNRELFGGASTFEQSMAAYVAHPLTKAVLGAIAESGERAVPLRFAGAEGHTPLPELVLDEATLRQIGQTQAEEFLTHFLAVAAHLRALAGEKWGFGGKRVPGVEMHMWVREVSRIERAIAPDDEGRLFRWADDGLVPDGEDTSTWLPACYCRNCGRSGWMTTVMPGDTGTVSLNSSEIWSKSIGEKERQRPLIDATAEYTAVISAAESAAAVNTEDGSRTLLWLHTARCELSSAAPTEEEQAEGRSIPVLSYSGTDAEDFAREEVCPSCGERDSIRFIGSRVATLLSVGLSNLFGMSDLDSSEKKTLVFSDSVQDAAHRAGFVQSRSRAFGVRTQIRHAVGIDPEQLTDLPAAILDAADSSDDPARSRYELLPLELASAPNYMNLWHPSATADQRRRAKNNTLDRLAFDLALEFGQRAHLSRSLTQTGAMSVYVDIADEVLLSAAAEALDAAGQSIMGVGDPKLRLAWTHGLIEMMRERGAIHHPWLGQYLSQDGNAWFLNRRDARARGIPAFPKGGAPEFPRAGAKIDDKDRGITPVGSPRGRYALWTAQVLQCSRHDAATILTNLFNALAKRGALKAVQTETGATIYALSPEQVIVRAEDANVRHVLECGTCRATHGIEGRVRGLLEGHRCFTPGCMGTFLSSGVEANYYSQLYESTEPRAIVAREHTGLIPKDERLALEQAFRGTDTKQAPDAPNVLVATPTLEMGIDIGDLSVVMLASLPTSVASYVQRVGRAGRLTGNSLVMAFVRGRGTSLPRLNDPLSIIGGSVNPPAAYLSATEILQRQVTAAIIDTIPFADYGIQINNAASVFSQSGNTTLVGVLLQMLEEVTGKIGATVDEFLATISAEEVDEALREQVRQWATGAGPDSLAGQLVRVRNLWDSEVKTLTGRRKVLEDRWVELKKLSDAAQAGGAEDAETERELRATLSALRRIKRDLSDIAINEYWIAAMERYGLLPNFTLLDDSVELAVSVSYLNPSTLEFETEPFELSRGVSSALVELAPGATFYARGIAASIDSVELGREAENLENWRLCPSCSYGQRDSADSPTACPSCGSGHFRDKGQVLPVVPLRKVSAEVDRSRAMIDSTHEERYNVWFHETMSFSVPTDVTQGSSWYISGGFGAEHLRFVDISWFNLGRGPASTKYYGGREVNIPLFTVCHECGHLDSAKGSNSKWDHRPWCSKRSAQEEDTISVALGRSLRTQGVLLHIPLPLLAGDRATVPSLIAAIKLGFKEVLGGDPDHLNIDTVTVPGPADGTVEALLMYDSVPGGTGYLSAFASPEAVRNLLEQAFRRVAACDCANDERLACPDCLLPYTPRRHAEKTSRAIAERALRALLLNDNHPNADTDPLTVPWEPQEEAPEYDPASHLEVRFREIVREALEGRKVEVTEVARAGKMEWRLDFPNGEQWFMREQEDKGYTRPDFYFEHRTRRGVRPVAVFTDGLAYHASDAHFGFPNDVERRARLATEGIIPWTITSADLVRFEDEGERKQVGAPGWMNSAQFKNAAAIPDMDENASTFLKASPVKQLLDYLAEPQRKAYSVLGNAVALVAVRDAPVKRTPDGFTQDFDDYILIDFARTAKRVWIQRMTADVTSGGIDSRSWNAFWNIANMLWLSGQPVGIHTSATPSELMDFSPAEEKVAEIASAAQISGQWREAIEDYGDIDIVSRAFHTLASVGSVPADEIGREMHSVVVAAVWDDQKVVVWEGDSSDHPNIADEMRDEGWTIIYPDQLTVESVPTRLQERKQ